MNRIPSISMQQVSRRSSLGWGRQLRCTYSDEGRLEQVCVQEYTEAGQAVANFSTGVTVVILLAALVLQIRDYINKR